MSDSQNLWINICMIDSDLFPQTSSWWFWCFLAVVFLWNELAVLAHLVPPPSPHSHGPILTSSPVVAPPSLPCSPPPSFLDPSLLPQASPLRRDTHRSHDDGDIPNRGEPPVFCQTALFTGVSLGVFLFSLLTERKFWAFLFRIRFQEDEKLDFVLLRHLELSFLFLQGFCLFDLWLV